MAHSLNHRATRSPRLPVFHRQIRHSKLKPLHRLCNLCEREFIAQTQFDRFCTPCRHGSDLLHYADWMPEWGDHRA